MGNNKEIAAKHTPGPWTVHQESRWPFDIEIHDSNGNSISHERRWVCSTKHKSIEEVMTCKGFESDGTAFSREKCIEANARQLADAYLKAAAPELLAALSDARKAAVDGRIDDVLGILTGDVCGDAIAKATGEK